MAVFTSLLIANRGEIAVRVARTARAMGVEAVTVHAADEAGAPHTRAGDRTVGLAGEGPSAYLDADAVVAAAVSAGCQAVHPGYGFLSEDATFARACEAAGLIFVGPSPATLDRFGDKLAARAAAVEAGVPVLPATGGAASLTEAEAFFDEHGPVMVKARGGGGGRGMRLVTARPELTAAMDACRREAAAAFGRDDVYVEAYLPGARHIEVQVVGDGTRVEHLHERDCTLQRRRQKVIETAPAFFLDDTTRLRVHDAAVQLTEHVGYRSVGTVEFLVSGDRFVFLEVNARLQVEHPVTEAITGLDLVELQLRLASGASLASLGLHAPPPRTGYAVEARIVAEVVAPGGAWVPAAGVVTGVRLPDRARVDTFLEPGCAVSGLYDSLVAKVVVHASEPSAAFAAAAVALDGTDIDGIDTNVAFLAELLRRDEVIGGSADVAWLDAHLAEFASTVPDLDGDGAPGTVTAPMQATVVAIEVAVGDEVPASRPIVILEAMKMEHVITAPISGTVSALAVSVGDTVQPGQVLAEIEPGDVAAAVDAVTEDLDLDHVRADLAEVLARHAQTLDAQRPDAVSRRRAKGKRTARENIADLVDAGSLIEYGPLMVAAQRKRRSLEELRDKTPADGLVGGIATVGGRAIAVASYDYTVLAGTQGLNNHRKKDRLFEVAEQQELPFVFFTEGGGGRPGDTDGTGVAGLDCLAFQYFGRLSGLVPLVGVASGYCFAGNAAILGCCDVVIATSDANIGMGGPAMIEGGGLGVHHPTEIGPAVEQVASGVVDVLVEDEAEAVAVARQYLDYFLEPHRDTWHCADQRLLRHVIPENRLRVYDVRAVIDGLFDAGSVLELRRGFGEGMVTALARVEGRSVGVVSNDPSHLAGAIDADGADKAARFLQLCDAHDVPVVFLCDTPGIMVGPDAERTGLVRHASRLFVTGAGLTVPFMTVVLRKGYGLGAQAMAGGSFHAPLFIVGWPTSEFGGMGLEGAVRLGYRNELDAIEDPAERQRTFEAMVERMYEVGKGTSMAAAFEIDDVIDPADTRRWITTALVAAPAPPPRRGKKRPNVDTW